MNQEQKQQVLDKKSKRTSYFYKKRLQQQQKAQLDKRQTTNGRIQKQITKSKKQSKTRAKQARQRKQKYIQFLQNRIKQLQQELQKKRLYVEETNQKQLAVKKVQSNVSILPLQGLQLQFQKLYFSVKYHNQNQTIQSIDILRDKYGVAGKDRHVWITSLFQKIVQVIMPMHCRLLLEHCQNSQQFYQLLGGGDILKQFRQLLFHPKAKNAILDSRPLMVQIKQDYQRILLQLVQIQHNVINNSTKIQNLINNIQKQMNPLFVGRILVNLDVQRKNQPLDEIFPVNFYNKHLVDAQNSIKQQSSEQYLNFSNDYYIFDELFRID